MGRGTIGSGLFRSERYGLDLRTTDPVNHNDGEAWIRTDLAPDSDQLATLRFDNGSGVWDIPIYDTAASVNNVKKAQRIQIAGTTGFIPVVEGSGAYDAVRLQHNGAVHSVHDSLDYSAIPDSAVNRWKLGEGSGSTFTDSIGGEDGTVYGATWSSGTWVDGYALSGDGSNDTFETDNPVSSWTDIVDTGVSYTFTVQMNNSNAGLIEPSSFTRFGYTNDKQDPTNQNGHFKVRYNSVTRVADTAIDDGSVYRIGVRCPDEDPNNWVFFHNGQEVSSSVTRDDGPQSGSVSVTDPMCFMEERVGSDYLDGFMDDIVFYDEQLTDQHFQDDYDRQPWS